MRIDSRRAICMMLASQGGRATLSVTHENTSDGEDRFTVRFRTVEH
jgi:hypothetical protein